MLQQPAHEVEVGLVALDAVLARREREEVSAATSSSVATTTVHENGADSASPRWTWVTTYPQVAPPTDAPAGEPPSSDAKQCLVRPRVRSAR